MPAARGEARRPSTPRTVAFQEPSGGWCAFTGAAIESCRRCLAMACGPLTYADVDAEREFIAFSHRNVAGRAIMLAIVLVLLPRFLVLSPYGGAPLAVALACIGFALCATLTVTIVATLGPVRRRLPESLEFLASNTFQSYVGEFGNVPLAIVVLLLDRFVDPLAGWFEITSPELPGGSVRMAALFSSSTSLVSLLPMAPPRFVTLAPVLALGLVGQLVTAALLVDLRERQNLCGVMYACGDAVVTATLLRVWELVRRRDFEARRATAARAAHVAQLVETLVGAAAAGSADGSGDQLTASSPELSEVFPHGATRTNNNNSSDHAHPHPLEAPPAGVESAQTAERYLVPRQQHGGTTRPKLAEIRTLPMSIVLSAFVDTVAVDAVARELGVDASPVRLAVAACLARALDATTRAFDSDSETLVTPPHGLSCVAVVDASTTEPLASSGSSDPVSARTDANSAMFVTSVTGGSASGEGSTSSNSTAEAAVVIARASRMACVARFLHREFGARVREALAAGRVYDTGASTTMALDALCCDVALRVGCDTGAVQLFLPGVNDPVGALAVRGPAADVARALAEQAVPHATLLSKRMRNLVTGAYATTQTAAVVVVRSSPSSSSSSPGPKKQSQQRHEAFVLGMPWSRSAERAEMHTRSRIRNQPSFAADAGGANHTAAAPRWVVSPKAGDDDDEELGSAPAASSSTSSSTALPRAERIAVAPPAFRYTCCGFRFDDEELEADYRAAEHSDVARLVPAVMHALFVLVLLGWFVSGPKGLAAMTPGAWIAWSIALVVAILAAVVARRTPLRQWRLVGLTLASSFGVGATTTIALVLLDDPVNPMVMYYPWYFALTHVATFHWLPETLPGVTLMLVTIALALAERQMRGVKTLLHEGATITLPFVAIAIEILLATGMRIRNRQLFASVAAAQISLTRWSTAKAALERRFALLMPSGAARRLCNPPREAGFVLDDDTDILVSQTVGDESGGDDDLDRSDGGGGGSPTALPPFSPMSESLPPRGEANAAAAPQPARLRSALRRVSRYTAEEDTGSSESVALQSAASSATHRGSSKTMLLAAGVSHWRRSDSAVVLVARIEDDYVSNKQTAAASLHERVLRFVLADFDGLDVLVATRDDTLFFVVDFDTLSAKDTTQRAMKRARRTAERLTADVARAGLRVRAACVTGAISGGLVEHRPPRYAIAGTGIDSAVAALADKLAA